MMVMLIFGWMLIACVIVMYSFGALVLRRHGKGDYDTYFWLCLGSFLMSLGIAEFAVMRVYQTMFLESVPFVQVRVAALFASATILCGLSAKVKALALGEGGALWRSPASASFVVGCATWAVFAAFWQFT